MKIRNDSNARQRIDGYGDVAAGSTITVPLHVGRSLCTPGSPFVEVKAQPRKTVKTVSTGDKGGRS